MQNVFLKEQIYTFFSAVIDFGSDADDLEDIAVGRGPVDGVSYIYVADIGNNDYDKNVFTIYRFPEPDLSTAT